MLASRVAAVLSAGAITVGFALPWLVVQDHVGSEGFYNELPAWAFIVAGGVMTESFDVVALIGLPVLGGVLALGSGIALLRAFRVRPPHAPWRLSLFLGIGTVLIAALVWMAVIDYYTIVSVLRDQMLAMINHDPTTYTLRVVLPLSGDTPDQQRLIADVLNKLEDAPQDLIQPGAGFILTLLGFAGCVITSLGLVGTSLLGSRLHRRAG
jgi:hypothetical protein